MLWLNLTSRNQNRLVESSCTRSSSVPSQSPNFLAMDHSLLITVHEMLPFFYFDFSIRFMVSIIFYRNLRWFCYHFPLFLSIAVLCLHFCELGAGVRSQPWEFPTPGGGIAIFTTWCSGTWYIYIYISYIYMYETWIYPPSSGNQTWQAENPLLAWLSMEVLRGKNKETTLNQGFSFAMFDVERVLNEIQESLI